MLESAGKTWKGTNGVVQRLESILASGGMNYVRLRMWVNPANGFYNLAYNLQYAVRVKNLGLGLYLDFHYSDTWADPGHQAIPAGWPTDLAGATSQIYSYTKTCIAAFVSQGTIPDIVSIGNEITAGLMWPLGTTSSYSNIATLLHSASLGVKDGSPSKIPKIMIHLDNGWSVGTQTNWYKSVLGTGIFLASDYDIQGVSFYPFYGTGATLANLKSSLTTLISTYGKDVIVAETDWPVSCSGVALSEPSVPVSAAGQTTWVVDVENLLKALPGGHGRGIMYWEPGWIGNDGLGSGCASNLLFDDSGTPYTSVNMYLA